jgi:hypothetical protein
MTSADLDMGNITSRFEQAQANMPVDIAITVAQTRRKDTDKKTKN